LGFTRPRLTCTRDALLPPMAAARAPPPSEAKIAADAAVRARSRRRARKNELRALKKQRRAERLVRLRAESREGPAKERDTPPANPEAGRLVLPPVFASAAAAEEDASVVSLMSLSVATPATLATMSTRGEALAERTMEAAIRREQGLLERERELLAEIKRKSPSARQLRVDRLAAQRGMLTAIALFQRNLVLAEAVERARPIRVMKHLKAVRVRPPPLSAPTLTKPPPSPPRRSSPQSSAGGSSGATPRSRGSGNRPRPSSCGTSACRATSARSRAKSKAAGAGWPSCRTSCAASSDARPAGSACSPGTGRRSRRPL